MNTSFVSLVLLLKWQNGLGAYINIQLDNSFEIFDNPISPGNNVTLDGREENRTVWTYPKNSVAQWMEYYDDTLAFIDEKEDTRKCASVLSDFEIQQLSNVPGIWVACQDKYLPEGCANVVEEPCHPFIQYKSSRVANIRTVKVTFALYALALLKITTGSENICTDYGFRRDPFSRCKFVQLEEDDQSGNGDWRLLVFTYDDVNYSFNEFRIQLISRYAKDVILVDKIEGTSHYLCDDGISQCLTTTEPPTEDTDGTDSTDETEVTTTTTTSKRTTLIEETTSETTPAPTESTVPSTSQKSNTTSVTETTTEPNAASKILFNSFWLFIAIIAYNILF